MTIAKVDEMLYRLSISSRLFKQEKKTCLIMMGDFHRYATAYKDVSVYHPADNRILIYAFVYNFEEVDVLALKLTYGDGFGRWIDHANINFPRIRLIDNEIKL